MISREFLLSQLEIFDRKKNFATFLMNGASIAYQTREHIQNIIQDFPDTQEFQRHFLIFLLFSNRNFINGEITSSKDLESWSQLNANAQFILTIRKALLPDTAIEQHAHVADAIMYFMDYFPPHHYQNSLFSNQPASNPYYIEIENTLLSDGGSHASSIHQAFSRTFGCLITQGPDEKSIFNFYAKMSRKNVEYISKTLSWYWKRNKEEWTKSINQLEWTNPAIDCPINLDKEAINITNLWVMFFYALLFANTTSSHPSINANVDIRAFIANFMERYSENITEEFSSGFLFSLIKKISDSRQLSFESYQLFFGIHGSPDNLEETTAAYKSILTALNVSFDENTDLGSRDLMLDLDEIITLHKTLSPSADKLSDVANSIIDKTFRHHRIRLALINDLMERLAENGCSNAELKEMLTYLAVILDAPSHFPGDDSNYLATMIFSISPDSNEEKTAITEIKEKLKIDSETFQASIASDETKDLDFSSSVLTLIGSFREVATGETLVAPVP
jgi:hypothetical protein